MAKFFCMDCGKDYPYRESLNGVYCENSPTKTHRLYEGPEQATYYCKICGQKHTSLRGLTDTGYCAESSTHRHQPFEGVEMSEYACRYCDKTSPRISILVSGSCKKSPDRRHEPSRSHQIAQGSAKRNVPSEPPERNIDGISKSEYAAIKASQEERNALLRQIAAQAEKQQAANEVPLETQINTAVESGGDPSQFLKRAVESRDVIALNRLFDLGIGIKEALINLPLTDENEAIVAHLIKGGADVNNKDASNSTPLMRTSDYGIVNKLILAGANVNATDESGNTALMLAANSAIIQRLLAGGAQVNEKNARGRTALMLVTDPSGIESLIKAGADVEKIDNDGKTALMYHAERGHTEAVRLLINAKANLDIKDTIGKTAIRYGASRDCKGVVDLLKSAGASPSGQIGDYFLSHKKPVGFAAAAIICLVGVIYFVIAIFVSRETKNLAKRIVDVRGSVLTLRAEPHIKGQFIASIPDGTTVRVVEEAGAEQSIEGSRGKWTKIQSGDNEGWVFGGFLKKMD